VIVNTPNRQRAVVKLGSGSIAGKMDNGVIGIKEDLLKEFVDGVCDLHDAGVDVIVVSSGAVAAGMATLSLTERPTNPQELGYLASVGQPILMELYNELFRMRQKVTAQVMPERDSYHLKDRREHVFGVRARQIRDGVIPIINENDPVVHTELTFGDNDFVATLEAMGMKADFLLLLTDQPGIMTADPRKDPDAKLIERIEDVTPELFASIGSGSDLGSGGGSLSKIYASDIARHSGVHPIIASVEHAGNLVELINGKLPASRFSLKNTKRYDLDIACEILDRIAQEYEQLHMGISMLRDTIPTLIQSQHTNFVFKFLSAQCECVNDWC
jgi:glutamate 5-kinase